MGMTMSDQKNRPPQMETAAPDPPPTRPNAADMIIDYGKNDPLRAIRIRVTPR